MSDIKINLEKIREEAKSQIKEEQPWLLTYADMMTLLFAFFVLLFSMSSPDPVKMSQIQDAMNKKAGKPEVLESLSEIKKKAEKIAEELQLGEAIRVGSDPRGITIDIDGDISFPSGSTKMKPKLKSYLQLCSQEFMKTEGDYRMMVAEGHTDSDPIPKQLTNIFPTNWELSASRAANVVNYLISQGVNSGRLRAAGYADRWPSEYTWTQFRQGKVNDKTIQQANLTEQQKADNRRIKIIFLSNED